MLPLIKFSDLDLLNPRIEHASRVLIETVEANMRGIPFTVIDDVGLEQTIQFMNCLLYTSRCV